MSHTASIAFSKPRPTSVLAALLSFHAVLAGVLAVFIFALALRPMADPDIYWHLRNAEYLLHVHRWIRQDMYAYTTLGLPWINHEWLGELPFYFGWRLWGIHGLLGVTIAALEVIFFGVFYLGWLYCGHVKTAWAVTFCGVLLGTVSFGPRTLLFGWILLVVELIVLARFEKTRALSKNSGRILWLLPPLFLLWVNVHGSWLIGLVILLVYFACGFLSFEAGSIITRPWHPYERRSLSRVALVCAAALFINPYGWRLVVYPFDLAFRQKLNIARVQEWQPLDLHSLRGRLLLFALVLAFISALVRRRSWKPYQLAFFLIGMYAAFMYSRFTFLAGILALPLLAEDLPWRYRKQQERRTLHLALLCLICAIGVRTYFMRAATVTSTKDYPSQALPFLRGWQPQGRVFNDYLWGGYLEQQTPQIPVLVDSRSDLFEQRGVLTDYLNAIDLKNSLQVLDKYRIRYVLFEKNTPFVYMLRQSSAWRVEYEDETTILFERASQAAGGSVPMHAAF